MLCSRPSCTAALSFPETLASLPVRSLHSFPRACQDGGGIKSVPDWATSHVCMALSKKQRTCSRVSMSALSCSDCWTAIPGLSLVNTKSGGLSAALSVLLVSAAETQAGSCLWVGQSNWHQQESHHLGPVFTGQYWKRRASSSRTCLGWPDRPEPWLSSYKSTISAMHFGAIGSKFSISRQREWIHALRHNSSRY